MKKKLKDLLDYEQPTKYIVATENYSDEYKTPVLTAGKSFILGYTDETDGIFNGKENSVIIFDDFTRDTKYVDFDFKVKSSAMKILHKKNEEDSLRFLYYAINKIDYVPFSHKRLWISDFSNFEIDYKTPDEQKKIAAYLDKIHSAIDSKKQQLAALDQLVKSKFVEMFGDVYSNPKYEVLKMGDICSVQQGLQIPISKRLKEPDGEDCFKYITIQYLNGGKVVEYIKAPRTSVICHADEILMTRTGNTGQLVTGVEGCFHNNFFKINYNKEIFNKIYFMVFLKQDSVKHDMLIRATTTTIPDLSHSEFFKIPIIKAPLEVQEKFAVFYQKTDQAKTVVKNQLALLTELLESKMAEYFG